MPGVVSPHELLHKLQLVQQEQTLASSDPPRLGPGLAPRFLGPSPSQSVGPAPNQIPATAAQKAALQFQVRTMGTVPILPTASMTLKIYCLNYTNFKRVLLTVPVCSGHLPPENPSHCGPHHAPLSQCVLSDKVKLWVDGSRSGELPHPSTQTPAAGGGPSSVQRSDPSHAPASDPGKIPSVTRMHSTFIHANAMLMMTCACVFQSDSSFMDTIYETYVSRFANDSSTMYQ